MAIWHAHARALTLATNFLFHKIIAQNSNVELALAVAQRTARRPSEPMSVWSPRTYRQSRTQAGALNQGAP
eukprot:scaffold6107_cov130-Isochrysis_galbana.AAC.14